jgi:hypothetical protein
VSEDYVVDVPKRIEILGSRYALYRGEDNTAAEFKIAVRIMAGVWPMLGKLHPLPLSRVFPDSRRKERPVYAPRSCIGEHQEATEGEIEAEYQAKKLLSARARTM